MSERVYADGELRTGAQRGQALTAQGFAITRGARAGLRKAARTGRARRARRRGPGRRELPGKAAKTFDNNGTLTFALTKNFSFLPSVARIDDWRLTTTVSDRRQNSRSGNADALSLPLEFELERSGRRVRSFLTVILLFVTVAFGVLALAPIRAAVIAPGAVRPSGATAVVHHERGGAVERVLAERGEPIAQGAPILTLRPEMTESELSQLSLRRSHLELRVERLRSLLETRDPDFASNAAAGPSALDNERQMFEADRTAYDAQIAALDAQRQTRLADAAARRREAESTRREIATLEERGAMLAQLLEGGYVTRSETLEIAGRIAEAESRLASVEGQADTAERSVLEVDREKQRFVAQRRAEWSGQLAELLTELDELSEQILRQTDLLSRLAVVAPVSGTVQMLGAESPGAVIPPGGVVAEIVPHGRELIADVRLDPSDIGHVQVGDRAEVRVTTFDPELYGEVEGVVSRISPTAFADDRGETYYQAELVLSAPQAGENPRVMQLQPGMTLFASILTEERSILGYLGKPFRRALTQAFSEP